MIYYHRLAERVRVCDKCAQLSMTENFLIFFMFGNKLNECVNIFVCKCKFIICLFTYLLVVIIFMNKHLFNIED